jgi:hypothetical protein
LQLGKRYAENYREVAIAGMPRTVEEAMSGVIEWWGDLPLPMKEAIEQFSHPTWGGN